MDSFGKRLRSVRLSKSISLRDLNDKSTVHYAIISQYENDITFPQVKNLVLLSNALCVNLHWLITGKGTKELPGAEDRESIHRVKAELAAARKELQGAEEQIKELKNQYYEGLQYINQLQKELLAVKNQK